MCETSWCFATKTTRPRCFGPVRLEPGQTYRVPFRTATTFQLACSVHEGGQVGIVVTAAPRRGLATISMAGDEPHRAMSAGIYPSAQALAAPVTLAMRSLGMKL